MTTQKATTMTPEASAVPSRARRHVGYFSEGVTSWNLV